MNSQFNGNDLVPTPRFTHLVIPVEILDHPELTLLEQHLLAWIDALYCEKHGGCFASNEYFAKRIKVKENTIAKALTKLRSLGLIEDISFNGRIRVIRALIGKYVDRSQSKSALDLNPTQPWIKIQPCIGQKSNPIYKDYSKVESKEENIQHSAAAAADDCFSSSSALPSPEDPPPDKPKLSKEAKKLQTEIENLMKSKEPSWNAPNSHFLAHQCDILLKGGATYQHILDVVLWALECEYWASALFTPKSNPGTVLRKRFSQWSVQMKAKKPKFGRLSSQKGLDEKFDEFMKGFSSAEDSNV